MYVHYQVVSKLIGEQNALHIGQSHYYKIATIVTLCLT